MNFGQGKVRKFHFRLRVGTLKELIDSWLMSVMSTDPLKKIWAKQIVCKNQGNNRSLAVGCDVK